MTYLDPRDTDRVALLDLIAYASDHGRHAPCLGDLEFIADDEATQRRAAAKCHACPVVLACRSYGEKYPREAGVLGSTTELDRKPSRAPARGKTTERIAS